MTKEEFLNKYNPERTIKVALSKSISASVQHNKLYNSSLSYSKKKEIRDVWALKLLSIKEEFVDKNWNSNEHNKVIIKLKNVMQNSFNGLIGFRISHSQKSISVFFKHLWCLGIIKIPPQCPVDRIILTRINAPYNERSWGYIDDIETHNQKIKLIEEFAKSEGYDNMCEWELFNFN